MSTRRSSFTSPQTPPVLTVQVSPAGAQSVIGSPWVSNNESTWTASGLPLAVPRTFRWSVATCTRPVGPSSRVFWKATHRAVPVGLLILQVGVPLNSGVVPPDTPSIRSRLGSHATLNE